MSFVVCPNFRDKKQRNIEDQGKEPNSRNNNLKWQSVNLVIGVLIIEEWYILKKFTKLTSLKKTTKFQAKRLCDFLVFIIAK